MITITIKVRRALRRYSGLILLAPAIVPLFLGVVFLLGASEAYYTWIRHDHPYTTIHQCRASEDGRYVTRQGTDDSRTDGIPCACGGIACSSVANIEQTFAMRFLQAGLFLFAGGIILFLFFKKRHVLAAKGLLPRA